MSRWLAPLMAFCLSFLMIATLAPLVGIQTERQIDFWLLWLASMLIFALPLAYLEIALVKRAKISALQALSSLTRDADASARWRLAGWLAVLFIPFFAGGMLARSSALLLSQQNLGVSSTVIIAAAAVLALILSLLARPILLGLAALGVLASLITANVMGDTASNWQMTAIQSKELLYAAVLALVATGLGLGMYGQTSLPQVKNRDEASKTVLPIWIAQLIAVLAFAFFSVKLAVPAITLLISAIAVSAVMLQMAREQLAHRQLAVPVQWLLVVIPMLLWAVPAISVVLNPILIIWGLVIVLIYAIFVGWVMKISHLRKALNFSNELFYNLWRIAVRIILPLTIILSLIAFIGSLL